MDIRDTHRFLDDRRRFALVHTCERCAFHDTDRDACAHGYPDARHRLALFEGPHAAEGTFCKEFELE